MHEDGLLAAWEGEVRPARYTFRAKRESVSHPMQGRAQPALGLGIASLIRAHDLAPDFGYVRPGSILALAFHLAFAHAQDTLHRPLALAYLQPQLRKVRRGRQNGNRSCSSFAVGWLRPS